MGDNKGNKGFCHCQLQQTWIKVTQDHGVPALRGDPQIPYHLMTAHGVTTAPWPVTTLVATLPVAVLGVGATLAHLITRTTPSGAHDRPPTEPGTEHPG